jgi:hypothetical protein
MVQRTRLLQCPNCEKQLEDTRLQAMTCKYCGHSFNRSDVVMEDEDYIRKKMIVDLRTEMDTYKRWKQVSTGFMAGSFVLTLPVLFSDPFKLFQGIVLGLYLVLGIVFFLLVLFFDRKYASSRSKATDLSMRKRL